MYPELSESRHAFTKEAKHAIKASAPLEDHVPMSGTHPRVWLRNQEARELQARCDNAVQDLAKRLDAAVRYMPAAGSHPSDSLEVHATKWARATRLQLEASWEITFEDKLQPHERKRLSELRRNLAKSEVVACAYDHILRRRPCYNTFTPDLRHVEPNSALACQLEMDDFHGLHRAGREAGGWPSSITAKQYMPPPQKQQRRQQQQQPRAQCKSKMSDEAQVDCLGSCVASLAFELISLVLQDMASVFFPPESTLNRSNPADQDRLDPHPSEAQSSDTNSRRSRLSKQAGQQQQTKREELQQQAEDELLEKSDRAQNCHAMHWRDLVAILFYLPDCMKMDARSPQTLWRIAESAHVATCMCQLLGLVFAFAKNNEPWARKVLACPSAEELARVLTMQVSSMVRSHLERLSLQMRKSDRMLGRHTG
ncbi:hypothetical protein DUNSADRAFT_5603 [Dunaliella salina]|uniref:Uncharacterized protein n=1 Tax=Dunaliella salina TaxID=3046 RepID=A0ABQ7GPZ3_DUNSA|nr:hypothetical protein DUNSADRAFT_5603 [Dunaliella salina]|eukprot:KAF5836677.1 hypothetical protein DUNSADRAFT_5603 [Dunaliella salina]